MNLSGNEHTTALEKFRPYLVLLARAHLHADARHGIEASDLVQQTLMDAYSQRGQFRGENDANLAAWLKQILVNNLVDALRHGGRGKRDVSKVRSLEAQVSESFSRADAWLLASQTSPSQHVAHKEDLLRLAEALEQLPEPQQEAVVLHHLQGLSLAEVARKLERSESAVAGLLYRGLKRLHELLDESS